MLSKKGGALVKGNSDDYYYSTVPVATTKNKDGKKNYIPPLMKTTMSYHPSKITIEVALKSGGDCSSHFPIPLCDVITPKTV